MWRKLKNYLAKWLNMINPFIRPRMQAYKATFAGPNAENVLADLKRFCFANRPTADINNPYATYIAEGRREVWLRIIEHLHLSEADVIKLKEIYSEQRDNSTNW